MSLRGRGAGQHSRNHAVHRDRMQRRIFFLDTRDDPLKPRVGRGLVLGIAVDPLQQTDRSAFEQTSIELAAVTAERIVVAVPKSQYGITHAIQTRVVIGTDSGPKTLAVIGGI